MVCPLLKKPSLDKDILKNYRPVSNLTFLSKVVERVICKRLTDHLQDNGLLDKFQSAYRPFHSTETALLRVQNDILHKIDQRKQVYLVLLDLSAAFDTIDHEILLSFMENQCGIKGVGLDIFRSYLTDRSQRVTVQGVSSQNSQLLYGVPQGSVLGPIIFCLYTLPICKILQYHGIDYHIYADDTQIYCAFDDGDAEKSLNRIKICIDDIRSWMIRNKLKINDDKTEFLIMASPRLKGVLNSNLVIGDSTIVPSLSCRNLGATFDNHLSMVKHVETVCKSMLFHLRNILSIRSLLTDSAASQLVHSLVTSRLDYCNSLLYGIPTYLCKKLQRVQNVAARILTQSEPFCHIQPVLYKLHWLPVEFRIKFKIVLLTFKCIKKSAPQYLIDLVDIYQPSRSLRSSDKFLLCNAKVRTKASGERCFMFAAPKEWNQLPEDLKYCSNLNIFKTKLKTHLFEKFYCEF